MLYSRVVTCEWRLLPTHGRDEFEAARPRQGRGMFGRRGAGRWKGEPDLGTDFGRWSHPSIRRVPVPGTSSRPQVPTRAAGHKKQRRRFLLPAPGP